MQTCDLLVVPANRYAYARQFRRMRREMSKLKTKLERVARDIARKISSGPTLTKAFVKELELAHRLLIQQQHDRIKFCIAFTRRKPNASPSARW